MKMKNFLKCCEDLVIQESGASAFELEKLKARQFPQAHLDLLSITNGLEFYGGYYRLFGTDSAQAITWTLGIRVGYGKMSGEIMHQTTIFLVCLLLEINSLID